MKRLSSRGFNTLVYDNDEELLARVVIDNLVEIITDYSRLDVLIIAIPPSATISTVPSMVHS